MIAKRCRDNEVNAVKRVSAAVQLVASNKKTKKKKKRKEKHGIYAKERRRAAFMGLQARRRTRHGAPRRLLLGEVMFQGRQEFAMLLPVTEMEVTCPR